MATIGRRGDPMAMRRRLAGWLANREIVPTAGQAVFGYYADTGVFDRESIQLKRLVDERTEAMIRDAFEPVEDELAAAFDVEDVTFEYDTKLTLPAELTLGQLYRAARERAGDGTDPVALSVWADNATTSEVDGSDAVGPIRFRRPITETAWEDGPTDAQEIVDRGEYLTRLVIAALIDGDMRDAINDEEFEDFGVSFRLEPGERERVAEIAQSTLQSELDAAFDRLPDEIEAIYGWAVDISERHQERDPQFRELLADAQAGDQQARDRIRETYRDAPITDLDIAVDRFAGIEELPYLKTQYARVGVIYDGMIEMYRRAGLPVDDAFKRSIVLAIIGAQIWLDDVDDFVADRVDNQLTPATAEYVLAADDRDAYEAIVQISERYLDLAAEYATETDSPLTGIAAEYIYRSGDPSVLPGHE
ncbi:hypothetical protein Hrd1104_04760 [Halorhabdus sp. CBA1104]|nr:hypothetical protein Hrd1104_04760 [Halorhabdus sp. CBA1104]